MDCGQVHEFALKKPNFCTNCSASLNPGATPPKTPKKLQAVAAEEDDEDIEEGGDDDSVTEVPKLTGLQVEIVPFGPLRGESLSQFAGTSNVNPVVSSEKGKKVNMKQFLKDFQQEAGTSRKDLNK
jgi:hypothetical protein